MLVADDDADLLDVTTYALRREGYNIVTATDGQQAVDRHLDETPDLVLLDVRLPAPIRAVLNRTHGGLPPEPEGDLTVGSLRLDLHSHEVTIRGDRSVR